MTLNKLAIVRSNNTHACPFGLSIPESCQSVGIAIHDMQPLDEVSDEQQEKYTQANRRVYRHSADGTRCPFADKLMKDRDFVVCDYGDSGAGEHSAPLTPSPLYPRVFVGMGQSGLYSYPLGSYNDTFPDQILDGVGTFQSYAASNEQAPLAGKDDSSYEIAGELEQPSELKELTDPANKNS